MKKRIFSIIVLLSFIFSSALPILSADAEDGASVIFNLAAEKTAYQGDTVEVRFSAELLPGNNITAMQADFRYSDNFPAINDGETKLTANTTTLTNMCEFDKVNFVAFGNESANPGRIDAKIVFTVPENAPTGTQYTVSLDEIVVSDADANPVQYKTETKSVTITVAELPEIEGISAEDYSGIYDGREHGVSVQIPENASIVYGTAEGTYDLTETPEYKNAGSYTVFYKVTLARHKPYSGKASVTISPKPLSDEIVGFVDSQQYTGNAIKPEISITDGNPSIISSNDYELTYGENTDVKTGGSVTVTAKNNYSGKITRNFSILPIAMTVSETNYDKVYDGNAHTAAVEVTAPGEASVKYGTTEGTYDLDAIPEYTNAGTYTVFYKAVAENYEDYTGSVTVKISPKQITDNMIADILPMDYTGTQLKPAINVSDGEPSIISVNDYDISYGENIGVKDGGKVTVTGKNNYSGQAEKTFRINPINMTFTAENYSGQYDGTAHGGNFSVTVPENADISFSTDGTNYDLSEMPVYTNAGSYTVHYKAAAENYNGISGEINVSIEPKPLTGDMFENIPAQEYTGSQIKPQITVRDILPCVITADDYDISYGENVNVGKNSGSVTIIGKGNYSGTVTRNFEIAPDIIEVNKSDYLGIYDKNAHKATVSIVKPANAQLMFGEEEGVYNLSEMPEYSDAGNYIVYFKATAENFSDCTGSVTVTINPKELTADMISLPEECRYTGERIAPDVTVSDNGIVDAENFDVSYGENIHASANGSVTVTGKKNYKGSITKDFKITKAPLTVKTENKTITYGDSFDLEISYIGFLGSDNENSLNTRAVISGCSANPNAGEYPLTLSGASSDDYEISYDNTSKLIVNKKEIVLTALNVFDKAYDGTNYAKINESSAKFDGVKDGDDVFIDISNAEAVFETVETGENIAVSISGLAIKGEASKNYTLAADGFNTYANIKNTLSAADIAAQITSVMIDGYQSKIVLPQLPDGYSIKIKSTEDESIIDSDGNVYAADIAKRTKIILEISNESGDDVAYTNEIEVIVPAKEKVVLNVTSDGNGTVSGGGEFFKYSDVTVTASPASGYEFDGWYNGDTIVSTNISYTFKIESSINLCAKFKVKTVHRSSGGGTGKARYTVILQTNGGNELKNITVTKGMTIGSIDKPTKSGYVFEGWYADEELTKPYDLTSKVTNSMTLYAKWSIAPERLIILTIGQKTVSVWGEPKENDVAPVIRNDRTMLPIRLIAEALGAKVEWDGEKEIVTVTNNEHIIKIVIGSAKAYVDNEEKELDCAAFIEADRTFLPIRFISENMGTKVEWNENEQKVTIIK